jgi:hypothetical protein
MSYTQNFPVTFPWEFCTELTMGGVIHPTGTLSRAWLVFISGVATSIGVIQCLISTDTKGVVTLAGNAQRSWLVAISGAVTLTGTLEVLDVILQAVGGVLSAIGDIYVNKLHLPTPRAVRGRFYRVIGLK